MLLHPTSSTGSPSRSRGGGTLALGFLAAAALVAGPQPQGERGGGDAGSVAGEQADIRSAPTVLVGHRDEVEDVAWSDDGRWLASSDDRGRVLVWDGRTGERRWELEGDRGIVFALAFAPGGALLASTGLLGQRVRLWDAAEGEALRAIDVGRPVVAVAFAPDGRELAAASIEITDEGHSSHVARFGVADGEPLEGSWEIEGWILDLEWSRDGEQLLACDERGLLHLIHLSGASSPEAFRGHDGPINDLALAPDGSRLATAGDDGSAKVWALEERRVLATFEGHGAPVYAATFSEDGSRLATAGADFTVRLWPAEGGPEHEVLSGHMDHVQAVAFRGRSAGVLASGSSDGTIRLWGAEVESAPWAGAEVALGEIDGERVTMVLPPGLEALDERERETLHPDAAPTDQLFGNRSHAICVLGSWGPVRLGADRLESFERIQAARIERKHTRVRWRSRGPIELAGQSWIRFEFDRLREGTEIQDEMLITSVGGRLLRIHFQVAGYVGEEARGRLAAARDSIRLPPPR